MSKGTNHAGKGDKPRNCFSKHFKDNFDHVVGWCAKQNAEPRPYTLKKGKKIYKYP
jgi:hypothetical protein